MALAALARYDNIIWVQAQQQKKTGNEKTFSLMAISLMLQ
jgi:hypothetical protein